MTTVEEYERGKWFPRTIVRSVRNYRVTLWHPVSGLGFGKTDTVNDNSRKFHVTLTRPCALLLNQSSSYLLVPSRPPDTKADTNA